MSVYLERLDVVLIVMNDTDDAVLPYQLFIELAVARIDELTLEDAVAFFGHDAAGALGESADTIRDEVLFKWRVQYRDHRNTLLTS